MYVSKNKSLERDISSLRSNATLFNSIYFFVLVLLFAIVLKVGYSKISEQKSTLSGIRERTALLKEKERTLSQARYSLIGVLYRPVSMAFPIENAVLSSFSGVRQLLVFYLLPVDSFSVNVGNEGLDKSSVNSSSLRLSILGKREQVISFLKDVESLSPLMLVNKLNLSSQEDVVDAEVTITSFWSNFVYQGVKIDTPLTKITDLEKDVLITLSKLKELVYLEVPASGPSQRNDPFSSP